mmetsp:Transcript_49185/g.77763  ORF Transcript_49185/g.77763 Transcript_49185/m.77763 type:complete len:413 (-) Transcript_49185:52-1290(-)
MAPSSCFFASACFFWICSAAKHELQHIDASLIRASHLDCDGQHSIACDTLQPSGVGADRTVHGFLLLPEAKSRWHAFPVGLMLTQHSTSVRDGSVNRIAVLFIGLVFIGALAYWLNHQEWPDAHDNDDTPHYSMKSPWEEAYQSSRGLQRESFELLFRTGIVSKSDRSSEIVNRGHIESSLRVAEEMLREKPLDLWLEQGFEKTQRAFEDRLAESYRSPHPSQATPPPLSPMLQERSSSLMPPPEFTLSRPSASIFEEARHRDFPNTLDELTPTLGETRAAPMEKKPPAVVAASFASIDTVSTVAAVDCGKKTPSPSSTVAAVDCAKKTISPTFSPASTVPQVDVERKMLPATDPILEEQLENRSSPSLQTRSKSPSEGTPVILTFPKPTSGKATSGSWQNSAARSLGKKPD